MGGVLTHAVAGIFCFIAVQLVYFHWQHSLAVFFGNFVPDVVKFGLSAVTQRTVNIFLWSRTGGIMLLTCFHQTFSIGLL